MGWRQGGGMGAGAAAIGSRKVQQSLRAATFACVTAGLTVFQVAAVAQIWSWVAKSVGLPSMGLGMAVALGCLVALVPSLFGVRRGFSWALALASLSRTTLLLAVAFIASRYLPHENWVEQGSRLLQGFLMR